MGERVHVYPVDDATGHDLEGDDCVCGPDTEFVESGGEVITHHSLDGREMCDDCKVRRATTFEVALNDLSPRGRQFCDECAPEHGMFPGERPR